MGKSINLSGMTFGRLKVIELAGHRIRNSGQKVRCWRCLCQCGREHIVATADLTCGKVKSCGCLRSDTSKETNTSHGFCRRIGERDRLYSIWNGMKTRCTNSGRIDYERYGERGISVCEEWEHNFVTFRNWAIKNGYRDGLTIDRIDVNGDYCPENCRWATTKEQARNKRNSVFLTFNGETKSVPDWADEVGIRRETLCERIRHGWSVEATLTTPVKGKGRSTTKPGETTP